MPKVALIVIFTPNPFKGLFHPPAQVKNQIFFLNRLYLC